MLTSTIDEVDSWSLARLEEEIALREALIAEAQKEVLAHQHDLAQLIFRRNHLRRELTEYTNDRTSPTD